MTIHSRQQRLVLGLLLARAGCEVENDELIRVLWGHQPPHNAHWLLTLLLNRLRARFAEDKDLRILTVGRRYRLAEVRSEELDLAVFRQLIKEARLAATAEEACGLLQRALRLWRAPALSCVPSPGMWTAVGAALGTERRAAVALHDKFRRLAAGRPGQLRESDPAVPGEV